MPLERGTMSLASSHAQAAVRPTASAKATSALPAGSCEKTCPAIVTVKPLE